MLRNATKKKAEPKKDEAFEAWKKAVEADIKSLSACPQKLEISKLKGE